MVKSMRKRSRSPSISPPARATKLARQDDALLVISENARTREPATPPQRKTSSRISLSPSMTPPSPDAPAASSRNIVFSEDLAPFFDRLHDWLHMRHDLEERDWDLDTMRRVALGVAQVAEAHSIEDGWVVYPARLVGDADRKVVIIVLVFPECDLIDQALFAGQSFLMIAGAVGSLVNPGDVGCYHPHPPLGSSVGLASLSSYGSGSLGGYLEDTSGLNTFVMTAGHIGAGEVGTDLNVQSPSMAICQPSNEDYQSRQKELERDIESQQHDISFLERMAAERRIALSCDSDPKIQRLRDRAAEALQTKQKIESDLKTYLETGSIQQRHLGTVAHLFRSPISFGDQHNGVQGRVEDAIYDEEVSNALKDGSVRNENLFLTMDWALVRSIRTGNNRVDGASISGVSPVIPGAKVKKVGRTTGRTTGRVLLYRVFASMKGNWMADEKGIKRRVITREYAVAHETSTTSPRANRHMDRQVFSSTGDSGSWIVSDTGPGPASVCGILIGGTMSNIFGDLTIFTPLQAVLDDVKARTGLDLNVAL